MHYFGLSIFILMGFRMDAVANIIYWPNSSENSQNPFGIDFLKKLNVEVHEYDPTFIMIGEDSTDFPNVTAPVHYGGLRIRL